MLKKICFSCQINLTIGERPNKKNIRSQKVNILRLWCWKHTFSLLSKNSRSDHYSHINWKWSFTSAQLIHASMPSSMENRLHFLLKTLPIWCLWICGHYTESQNFLDPSFSKNFSLSSTWDLTRTKISIGYAKENDREKRERDKGRRRDIEREGEIRERERERERWKW